jgi:hypothetical protein
MFGRGSNGRGGISAADSVTFQMFDVCKDNTTRPVILSRSEGSLSVNETSG